MPKTPPPPSRRGGSSRRSAPVKVTQPKPWGVIVGSVALGVALVALLVYAVLNQGGGVSDIVRDPDNAIEGVQLADEKALARNHVTGPVKYEQLPPPGGDHNGVPQTCDVYTEPIAPEHAVHSLEHGAVWVTYNDSVSEDDVATLADQVRGDAYRLMSPLPEQKSPIVLTAWGRTLEVDSADDERVGQFLEAYTNGEQTPERGAACVGVTTTGPLEGTPTDAPTMPAASPSAAPSAAATPSASPAAQ
jgi:Protein of unknown function (DUF3105)